MPTLRPLLWLLLAPRADGLAALPRAALARPSPPCSPPRSLSLPLPMVWHTRSPTPHMLVRRAAATVIPAFQFARPMKGALVIVFLVSAIIAWKRSPKGEAGTVTEMTVDEEEPVPETPEADSSPSIPASSLWVDQALEKVRNLRDAPPVPPPPKPSVAWSAPPAAPKPVPPPPPPTLVSPPAQSIPAPPTAPTLEETPVMDPPAPPVPEASAIEEAAAVVEKMEPPPAPSPVASPPPPPKEAIAPAPTPPPISPPVPNPPPDVTATEMKPEVSPPPTPAPSPDPLPKSSATPVVSSAPPAQESRPLPPSVPSPSTPAVSARKPMAAGLMRRLKEGVY